MKMKRVNEIFQHPRYQECLKEIGLLEEGRKFCRHTPEHFLDVARITCLLAWERGMEVNRETVYAAGLLHDIGRAEQYRRGTPHEQAGAAIAGEILPDCGFSKEEQEEILNLIRSHREKEAETDLAGLFYRADKLSRNCFSCPAEGECDWPKEKKNREISF